MWRFAFVLYFAACTAGAAQFIGRQVSAVLDGLQTEGLSFVYNTQIIPDALTVTAEPSEQSGVALAEEILAAHGLKLKQVAPRTYVVVAGARPPGRENPPPRIQDNSQDAERGPIERVIVQTSRYAFASQDAGTHAFLSQEQIQNLPRLADETLSAVQRLPGAAVNGFSSLGPVRGGAVNETAVLLDGLRLYEPFHLKDFLSPVSLLDSRIVAAMDVYSGGFPVVYGDRMSGIIDARSVRPQDSRYYELGLSVFHLNALASTAFAQERGHALISARRGNIGELARFSENDFGEPRYADGFVRLDYDFTDATRGSFDLLLSHDSIEAVADSATQRANDGYHNGYAWATLEHDWSDRLASRVIVSYTDVENDRRGSVLDPGRRTATINDQRAFAVFGLRFDNELTASRLLQRFGGEVQRLEAEYDYASDMHFAAGFPFPASPALDISRLVKLHPDGYATSAYWDGKFDWRRFTVQAGLRFDTQTYDGSDDSAQFSPRVGLHYAAGSATQLRASWGRFYQPQAINELPVQDSVSQFYPAQYADHTIVAVEQALSDAVQVRLEAYRKDYRRITPRFENFLDPLVLLPEVQFDRISIVPQSARAEGAELLVNWRPPGAFSGWLSYAWSQVRDRINGRDVPRSWDQRHAVSAGLAWAHGPWAVTFAQLYHTGWPTTSLQWVPATSDTPASVAIGVRNADRYSGYHSLDLRVTRTFTLGRGELDVFFEASNLASHANPCCTTYQVVEDSPGNYRLQKEVDSWLPLVPSFGVLWRYGQAKDP